MFLQRKITASIVIYKEDFFELQKAVNSVLKNEYVQKLYLIDNSPTNRIENNLLKKGIEYIFVGENIGFGAAHNLILEKIKNVSDYHLILNPDASFNPKVLNELVHKLEENKELTMIAPKVLFPDGKLQNSCRRYPKLNELFFRRFPMLKSLSKQIVEKGIYANENLEEPLYADYLTGCFHLYKTEDLLQIGGFDERYFLYMEDVDICKKIDEIGKKKLYYPLVHIQHVLKQKSAKNLKLFIRHVISMIKYYKKWGF